MSQTTLTAMNRDLLKAAVLASGWRINEWRDELSFVVPGIGTATITGDKLELIERNNYGASKIDDLKTRLKVAYSKEAVKAAASKFGWQVATVGENKMKLKRRG